MAMKYDQFIDMYKLTKTTEKAYHLFLRQFLLEQGLRLMAKTKKLTPVDTGNLRNRWELSKVYELGNGNYGIMLFNPAEYASWVEEGHMQHRRFVPGTWKGSGDKSRFVYDPKADGGMMLQEKWIPGFHMARISLNQIKAELPARYERALEKWLSGQFMP